MKQEQSGTTTQGAQKRKTRTYRAKEKAQAVLSLWCGRRNTSALMKELDVPWALINSWEKRALAGVLTALDPTWKQPEEGQQSLPMRLEKLIEQTMKPAAAVEPAATN